MKTIRHIILVLTLAVCTVQFAFSQTKTRPVVGVLNIETKGLTLDPQQMGNLVRMELEKLDTFSVVDKYDVIALAEKKQLVIAGCYGKSCLVQVGSAIGAQYMLTGSVEQYTQTIVVTLRMIDVEKDMIVKSSVMEFLNLPIEIQQMVSVSVRKMFGYSNAEDLVTKLTKKFDYESSVNNPAINRLNLQGPRLGFTLPFGETAEVISRSTGQGGYGKSIFMFQFGYQFEVQYLNEGKFQALFEFLPMITGLEQGSIIPSVTFMNGFRNNVNGLEIAFGPAIGFASYARVADVNGSILVEGKDKIPPGTPTSRKLDSRGVSELTAALVFAFGRTIKSGKLNIPINAWFTFPTKEGFRVGISLGYNSKR